MTDVELRDELMTLLLAGHETTATALAWTFERLVRHPGVLSRLSAAVDDGDEGYVGAVAKEALRVRPVVADMGRMLTEPMELGGYRVPAGWWVAAAVPLLHGCPAEFTGPQEFRPERFLGRESPGQAWIPFGGGRRQCVGSQFALLEMQAVIPEVISHLRLSRAGDPASERIRVRNVTLVPASDARVIAQAR
jgi:cytochrome P450